MQRWGNPNLSLAILIIFLVATTGWSIKIQKYSYKKT
jgi:hypothetical protein